MTESKETKEMEPMWPSLVALLAAGGLYAALPQSLALGPRWLLMALVLFTLAPSEILHSRGHHRFCRPIGFFVISVVTIGMIVSVVLLVRAIPAHVVDPEQLLHSATALWVSNILVFAVWYWRLDAGGPHQRSLREHHTHNHGAFLFPQMTLRPEQEKWSPLFVDYLFPVSYTHLHRLPIALVMCLIFNRVACNLLLAYHLIGQHNGNNQYQN